MTGQRVGANKCNFSTLEESCLALARTGSLGAPRGPDLTQGPVGGSFEVNLKGATTNTIVPVEVLKFEL